MSKKWLNDVRASDCDAATLLRLQLVQELQDSLRPEPGIHATAALFLKLILNMYFVDGYLHGFNNNVNSQSGNWLLNE